MHLIFFSLKPSLLVTKCYCQDASVIPCLLKLSPLKTPVTNSILKILVPFVTSQRNCFQSDLFDNAYWEVLRAKKGANFSHFSGWMPARSLLETRVVGGKHLDSEFYRTWDLQYFSWSLADKSRCPACWKWLMQDVYILQSKLRLVCCVSLPSF